MLCYCPKKGNYTDFWEIDTAAVADYVEIHVVLVKMLE